PVVARDRYTQACAWRNAEGCESLGILQESNTPRLPNHLVYARAQYQLACQLGQGSACWRLGFLDEKDGRQREAVAHYDEACERGALGGCVALAVASQLGKGVARNRGRAAELYQAACEKHESRGC